MGRVERTFIETEMRESYINYAMSVIRGRAIPDVRDGLKPVQRRILYAMHQLGLASNKPHRKCARIVGECFVAGTLVATDRGLIPIETVQRGDRVFTENDLAEVEELYVMPPRPLLRVELNNGLSATATPAQPFRVLRPDLSFTWKRAEELQPGDWIVLRTIYPNSSLKPLGLSSFEGREMHLTESLAYLLGLWLADGWVAQEGKHQRIGFYSSRRSIMERVAQIIEKEFGYRPTIERKRPVAEGCLSGYTVRISQDAINEYLIHTFRLEGWTAATKRIPSQLFRVPKSVVYAFLSGLIDGDGSVHHERNLIRYVSISSRLIDDLQILLHHLGIPARRSVQKPGQSGHLLNGRIVRANHPGICLEISGEAAQQLARQLTLFHPEKSDRLRALLARTRKQGSYDLIPWGAGVVFGELSQAHLGGGWYRDKEGRKFRRGIQYPSGTKIRYSSTLTAQPLHQRQLEEWGILEKLERIGSPLADRLRYFQENGLLFAQVKAVFPAPPQVTYDLGVHGDHQFIANGIVVHNCMGKYHPHGDQAIYDTLVNMAQLFSYRYPLVDGQGNFGSLDGDEPAAMRYTEARLAPIAEEFLKEIDEETVNFVPNFDDSLEEPEVLPARVPNLLVNGSWGISVGMTTQIPPHNLGEIVDALIYLIEHPEADWDELKRFIQGPDFPTGGLIVGREGFEEAYKTGEGKIRVRARAQIEDDRIVITEIPYQVRKSTIVETIAGKVRSGVLDEISDLRDESDREGLRIVVELKRGVNPRVVLNKLYKYTPLEWTFGANFLVIVDGNPRKLSLKELLGAFLAHRREVVRRRTAHRLRVAQERAHILEGLLTALRHQEEIIRLIRESKEPQAAIAALQERYDLSEAQADAILKMRLRQLTSLERGKIQQEYDEKQRLIREYTAVLESPEKLDEIIKDELLEIKEKYADGRRTEIVSESGEFEITDESLIPDHDLLVGVSAKGYVNAPREDVFRKQHRGGKGVIAMRLREGDTLKHIFTCNARDDLLVFTSAHKAYKLKAYQLPSARRDSKGENLRSLIGMTPEEEVLALLPLVTLAPEEAAQRYCLMATAGGIVNRNPLADFLNAHTNGIVALNAEPGDFIVDVTTTDGRGEVMLASAKGQTIRFPEAQVRLTGRPSKGVIGMRLNPGDRVVAMSVFAPSDPRDMLLFVTERGFGKRTPIEEFPKQNRGGKGVLGIKVSPKTGRIVAIKKVKDDDELMITTEQGKIIRIAAGDVRIVGRYAMGVKLIDLDPSDRVVSIVRHCREESH
jgi:DNA gyrase subunit A